MDTKFIAVLSQKGGAGKTTVSTNLAAAIERMGYKTCLIDTDPQGSSIDWSGVRGDDPEPTTTFPVIAMGKNLSKDARAACSGVYDFVVIDGAPRMDELLAPSIRLADLVVCPVQPSPYEIWSFQPVLEALKTRQEVTDGLPLACFLVNRVKANAGLSKEIAQVLGQYEPTVLAARLHDRVAFAESATIGGTVLDADGSKAAEEVKAMAAEIISLLREQEASQ
ncbi:ParA family partition ATPase [Pokkaliibacter sp. CJK22405]|uniref:ParA family partition ATPase n=1 Tax=Pokkaliibacter sp. CJK22405 TaxID=3384615 RepID=UPI003984A1FE